MNEFKTMNFRTLELDDVSPLDELAHVTSKLNCRRNTRYQIFTFIVLLPTPLLEVKASVCTSQEDMKRMQNAVDINLASAILLANVESGYNCMLDVNVPFIFSSGEVDGSPNSRSPLDADKFPTCSLAESHALFTMHKTELPRRVNNKSCGNTRLQPLLL